MRYPTILASLSMVAVLGACAPTTDIVTRTETVDLTFRQSIRANTVEDQAFVLSQLGDQLVRQSSIGGATPVSDEALVRSIDEMNSQMDVLTVGLPALLEEQNTALDTLKQRRKSRDISRAEYNDGVEAIDQSRARIADALSMTALQAERAAFNIQAASYRGQPALDGRFDKTAQLARKAQSASSTVKPVKAVKSPRPKLTTVTLRSGVLR